MDKIQLRAGTEWVHWKNDPRQPVEFDNQYGGKSYYWNGTIDGKKSAIILGSYLTNMMKKVGVVEGDNLAVKFRKDTSKTYWSVQVNGTLYIDENQIRDDLPARETSFEKPQASAEIPKSTLPPLETIILNRAAWMIYIDQAFKLQGMPQPDREYIISTMISLDRDGRLKELLNTTSPSADSADDELKEEEQEDG